MQKQAHPSLTEAETSQSVSSVCVPQWALGTIIADQTPVGCGVCVDARLRFLPLVLAKGSSRPHVVLFTWYSPPKYNGEKWFPCANQCCKIILLSKAALALSGTKSFSTCN